MFHHSDNKNIGKLKDKSITVKPKSEIHHCIGTFLTLKNLDLPDPPNSEYFPKNSDLNQCWVTFIFDAKPHNMNTKGQRKQSQKLKIFDLKIMKFRIEFINHVIIPNDNSTINAIQNKRLFLKA